MRAIHLLASVALIGGACTPDVVGVPTVSTSERASRANEETGATDLVEPPLRQRYDVAIDVPETVRPGKTATIQVRVTAAFPSPATTVRLIVPELQPVTSLLRGERPAVSSWVVSIDSAATASRSARLTFPAAGKYTVMVDASYGGALDAAPRVTDVGSSQVTVDVRDKSATLRKDPAIVTTGVGVNVCANSVAIDEPSVTIVPCDTTSPPPPAPAPPPGLAQVTGRVQFTGPGISWLPLRRVRVTYTTANQVVGTSRTDENGYFTVACFPSITPTSIRFDLDDASDIIITETVSYSTTSVVLGLGCTSPNLFISGWQEARVWDNMLRTVDGSRSYFQFTRPRLEVVLASRFGSISMYRRTSDFVVITPDAVDGSWGVFTAAHEYGHAVQAKLPAGIPYTGCPNPHYLETPSNVQCAYVEGWADYHSVAALPAGNALTARLEADSYRGVCGDNMSCESLVAATLLDLTDPVNPADPDGYPDSVSLPGRQILDMFGSCQLYWSIVAAGAMLPGVWVTPANIRGVRDCLRQDYPRFVDPSGGYIAWWDAVRVPWAPVSGTLGAAVDQRFAR